METAITLHPRDNGKSNIHILPSRASIVSSFVVTQKMWAFCWAFLIQRSQPINRATCADLKLWQCDHRNQDFDNKPETHRKGSQSIDNLNCASRGDATGNRGLLGVMAGALITQVIRVPKSFIERHGQ